MDSSGIPFLAPEIQLLYKALAIRAEDQADYDHVAPRLDADARTWLRTALRNVDPRHAWLISSPHLCERSFVSRFYLASIRHRECDVPRLG